MRFGAVSGRARLGIAAAVLLTGALAYFARPIDPVAIAWVEHAGLESLARGLHRAREHVYAHVHLPGWFRGAASDFAYAFSLGVLLGNAPRGVIAVGLVVVLSHEIAQGLGLVAGTFDVVDLVVLCVGFGLALFLFRPRGAT